MDADEVCLVLVFNHHFERNLNKLDALYGERFPRRVHLMPFYQGDREDVIRVYESAHQFQGFFAQAHAALSSHRCSHYVFCGDDLLLHPSLHAGNFASALDLSPRAAFIKSFASLATGAEAWPGLPAFQWEYAVPALLDFVDKRGVEWRQELPTYTEAVQRFCDHGVSPGRLRLRHLSSGWQVRSLPLFLFYLYKRLQQRRRVNGPPPEDPYWGDFPYPLAKGYSDLFVLPQSALDRFCHLCGVFAALGLFVEIAVPTALLLCCDEVRQEGQTRWHGVELWGPGPIEAVGAEHGYDLARLNAAFAKDQLYLHPVKLSRWQL